MWVIPRNTLTLQHTDFYSKKNGDLENATLSTNMMNLCEFWVSGIHVKFPGCIDACNALRQKRSLKQ